MTRPVTALLIAAALLLAPAVGRAGGGVRVPAAPHLPAGASWVWLELEPAGGLPPMAPGWDGRVLWDLRPLAGEGSRRVRWSVVDPVAAGLAAAARDAGAASALCPTRPDGDIDRAACRLLPAADHRDTAGAGAGLVGLPRADPAAREPGTMAPRAVAEGIVLVPAGAREVVLLREVAGGDGASRLRYHFVTRSGLDAALLEGPAPAADGVFTPDRGGLLIAATGIDDGIAIPYASLSRSLKPGSTGFLQRSLAQPQPLAAVHPGWTSVAAMIAPDAANVPYQPDPGDAGSAVVLPEVWDFTTLVPTALEMRTFNTVRDDLAGASCPETCAVRNLSAAPPDGTWQSWLKIDHFTAAGVYSTRDVFTLNDNDLGADPSIDVPYLAQDELNTSDRTQICFAGSAGGSRRLLRFFHFTGPNPASATLGVGDTWTSGAWTSCNDTAGLRLTLASACGDTCYPGCNSVAPRARGMLASGAGFAATIVDDGFVHVAAGNYVPALLMRQDTDLQAGRNLLGTCNLGTVRNRSFDYFWLQEHYGLLALVSAPSDGTGTLPPDDWSSLGNITDRVDVTWGPFPPYQIEARACLAGTLAHWALPADGSNLTGSPGITDWGYVVSWGAADDPESLADWTGNPNHTPLPGQPGYLAAPPGAEPTSAVIAGWAGPSIDITVVTALRYLDPDLGDLRSYRSAAFYRIVEDPARLDPALFVVGDAVDPFVTRAGDDLALAWPAVAGASAYRLRVIDLDTRQEIPCPAGLDCSPTQPSSVHAGGATAPGNLGYVAYAVDPCSGLSSR